MTAPRRTGGRRAPVLAAALLACLVATVLVFAQGGLRLPGLGGQELRETELGQGATIVVVWTTWSPKCRDIDRRVAPLVDRWTGKARVVTVAFQDDEAAVRKFMEGRRFTAPVYFDTDGEFAKKHAVTTVPGLLVIQDGRATYRGRLPDDPDAVIAPLLE